MIAKNKPIWKADIVKEAVEEQCGQKVYKKHVCKLLHDELNLSYRRVRKVPI